MFLIENLRLASRKLWGRIRRKRDLSLAAAESTADWVPSGSEGAYFASRAQGACPADVVEERTWEDLEMQRIFARFARRTTPVGAQYLLSLLRIYQPRSVLQGNASTIAIFRSQPELAVAFRRLLRPINREDSAHLVSFLESLPLKLPKRYRLFYILSVLAVACPFGLLLSPWFLPGCVALWLSSIVLQCLYGRAITQHAEALASLRVLLGCVKPLSECIQHSGIAEAKRLQELGEVLMAVRKPLSPTFLQHESANDLTLALVEYLNVLCLFELSSSCRALSAINLERENLLECLEIVARLDALQAVADAFSAFPVVCRAELIDGAEVQVEDIYHPMLQSPVVNSIQTKGRSILLTGTNMAGKTTFVKTLTINLLLAQTVGLCLARRAVLPPLRLKTLINRADSLAGGQSYFYSEAKEILRMLDEATRCEQRVWFVLDEVFRGTNSRERVAAGTAVLSHLARHGVTVASTHDVELAALLSEQFDAYHFSEVVASTGVHFDYRLRPGVCTSRNAIKLLHIAGYPEQVIATAQQLVAGGSYQ